jgi:formylglycine-generating enzyme required for sulfatase activity
VCVEESRSFPVMFGLGRVSKNKKRSVSLVGQPKSFLAPSISRLMTAFTVDRIPATVECFTEPLQGLGNAIPLDMVLVPSGTFEMGSPENEPERSDTEGSQRTVTLPSFFMGRYPITQAQWRAVAKLEQVDIELASDPSNFKGNNRPVERVSWYEAVEFCKRLHKATKRPYRLPSEAEWEYACRAGTTTPFAFGKMLTTEIANYDGNYTYNDGPEGEYRRETTPVDEFGVANAFGLCDMHGNVDEWCADHWHENYKGAPTDGSAWATDEEAASRVLRGGSWDINPRDCRSASRIINAPGIRFNNAGFRVSCRAPRALQPPTG